jgi:DNA-directed RNA polymerase beta subunit
VSRLLVSPSDPLAAYQPPEKKVRMRGLGDSVAMRQTLYDNVLEAANNMSPIANARHTLSLADVHFDGPEDFSKADQKQALLSGETLSRRLRGTWQLTDNATGQTLDQQKMTIARIPFFTERGTTISRGNELVLRHQQRLRPAVYTRVKDNGEIEAHANILPGKGMSHRYHLDPKSGVFYLNAEQAKIPLLPLMKTLGATDRQLQEAWGPKLVAANYEHDNPAAFNKLFTKLVRRGDPAADPQTKQELLRSVFENMEVDPSVMNRTLGKPYDRLNLDAVLDATKKLLAVSRGEAEVDDRDHLANQTIHGPEDLIAERLRRDYGGLRRKLLLRASFQGSLKNMPVNALDKQVQAALLHSGLGQALEEINPADVFDQQSRITRMGEGGIPSMDAVPDEARSVQPSHFGFMDPIRTPESFKVGVDVSMARGVMKGSDGKIYAAFLDPKTGKTVNRTPEDVADLAIAFSGEMARPGKRAVAIQKGKMRFVKKQDIDLVLPHFEDAMSPLANMVPLKSMVKGQRVAMGSRYISQAVPVTDPEAPLVQSGKPDGQGSYEEEYASHMGALRADAPGTVLAVEPGQIVVRNPDGSRRAHELYNNFPYNRKTFLHQTPVVKPGDTVQPGQLLARSNYTDQNGVTALGKNARVAYIPFRGLNTLDAVVVSEAFAKRMSSEHMYQHNIDWDDEHKRGRGAYVSLFPGKLTRTQLETLDDDGVVQPGTQVNYHDPLIVAAHQREGGYNRVHKKGASSFSDASLLWKHESPGVVTDVVKGKKGTTVVVKAIFPTQVGDKLSGRYGDKGVIADVIPDDQMPHDQQGRPFEVLMNPVGIISRTNPAQVVEAVLGKIAAQRGTPYKVPDFEDLGDLAEYAIKELTQHGMTAREPVVDPTTGRKITGEDGQGVLTGNRFVMKLHHMAESKGQSRGMGSYTQSGEPAKGGESGAKRLALMDTNALLSHGATQVLRDSSLVRGQRNEDYWLQFMRGHTPADPQVPMVYQKFVNELKASGINVVPEGHKLNIMALTDKDVSELSGNREITSSQTVRFDRGLQPIPGGLFDPTLTGGHHGTRWSHIKLPEPMPNPVMEEPIRRMLDLTGKQFESVLAGRTNLGDHGTGPQAIQRALAAIHIPRAMAIARAQIKGGRASVRDQAVKKLGYLKSAQQMGLEPRDWLLTRVPVLPPMFRPISVMAESKLPLVTDANYLYKELLEAKDNYNGMKGQAGDLGDERLAIYHSFKAITGLGDPLQPKLQEKKVQGLLKHIFGSSPKFGTVQRRLISSNVDLVGRASITPNPDLDMDHVGLPESRAWDLYKVFVARRLQRRGLPLVEAIRHVRDRSPLARDTMLKEMEERPVYIHRAPVLHRFGIMAFWPKLTKSHTLQVSPLICKGFNADFDGDAMNYHLPVGKEAVDEAIDRMMPSRNLLSPADFKTPVHKPEEDYVGGLYSATKDPPANRRPSYFRSKKDAIAAYLHGNLPIDTPVVIQS